MTKQSKVWQSEFGESWTDRTSVDPNSRVEAFRRMIGFYEIQSILEVGSNRGYNLQALAQVGNYDLVGVDVLAYSRPTVVGNCLVLPFKGSSFDLVFTSGMLMHVTPENLQSAVDELARVSGRYVLIIEYYSFLEEAIPWRGHDDLLWKRDYSAVFDDMNQVDWGFWSKEDGFDDCHWWLFSKGEILPFKLEIL